LVMLIDYSMPDSVNTLLGLYNLVPKADPLEALLATTALFFCNTRGENHPQQEQLQQTALKMLLTAANSQGINVEDKTAITTWMATNDLNDPNVFLPALITHLETLIGEDWLFDHTPLLSNS
ncbi:MAG: hypothetical protein AAGJ69_05380, partial [Cyanobacteria bacterium J06559_1]